MSLRVLPDPPEDGDDSLHDEIEAMFKQEEHKARKSARAELHKKFNLPPGYYDDKDYSADAQNSYIAYKGELFEIKRQKYPKKRKGKK